MGLMKGIRIWGLGFSLIKISLILFIFLISIPYILYPLYAQTPDIGYSKISPSSPMYFLKGVREDLELKLALTPHVKRLRELEFATRRLRETRTLISSDEDLIPPTLERYIFHLNTLSDQDLQDEEITARVKDSLVIHLGVLQQIYADVSSDRAKMALRSAMNRIIRRADVPTYAKVPICQFFLKEASSSALNQTEQVVLKTRSQSCLNTFKVNILK